MRFAYTIFMWIFWNTIFHIFTVHILNDEDDDEDEDEQDDDVLIHLSTSNVWNDYCQLTIELLWVDLMQHCYLRATWTWQDSDVLFVIIKLYFILACYFLFHLLFSSFFFHHPFDVQFPFVILFDVVWCPSLTWTFNTLMHLTLHFITWSSGYVMLTWIYMFYVIRWCFDQFYLVDNIFDMLNPCYHHYWNWIQTELNWINYDSSNWKIER